MYKNILFDLDGTLIDSKEGIINGFIYALKDFNIEVKNRKELEQFIGPPLKESFMNYYKFTEKQAEDAIVKYREFYRKTGVMQNNLYEGIKELVKDLAKNGKNVLLATSKPEEFAKQILEMHGINEDFYFIGGATFDGTRMAKKDVIKYAMDSIENVNVQECIMVGDRKYDIEGAKINNIKSVGVLYGFGSKEELEKAGADYIAEDAKSLRKILL